MSAAQTIRGKVLTSPKAQLNAYGPRPRGWSSALSHLANGSVKADWIRERVSVVI